MDINLNVTIRHDCPDLPTVVGDTAPEATVSAAIDPGKVIDFLTTNLPLLLALLKLFGGKAKPVAALVVALLLAGSATAQSPAPPGPPPSPAHEWAYLGAGGSFQGWGWGLKGVARPALGSPGPGGACLPAAGCAGGACGVPAAYPQFAPAYPVFGGFGGGCPGGRCR